jgi:hypothetical protein
MNMEKMMLRASELYVKNAIRVYEAKLQNGTGSLMTKKLLKESKEMLAEIKKELSELK